MIEIPRVYIAAIKKTSGKTTIAIALNRIFKEMNMIVQPFKKGPDFIDPMWHTQAAGRACRNLDFFFVPKERITNYFISKAKDADISVIEGNHGLFDDMWLIEKFKKHLKNKKSITQLSKIYKELLKITQNRRT